MVLSSAVTPLVIHALADQAASALPHALVPIGFKLGEDPTQTILMVAVDDAASPGATNSSDGAQTMATLGTPRSRDHSGTVNCVAYCWNGDNDQARAMDDAYATVAVVEGILRADPTLGLAAPGRMICQITEDRLSVDTTTEGAYALVIFTVSFLARI